jgi:hypothetical protein
MRLKAGTIRCYRRLFKKNCIPALRNNSKAIILNSCIMAQAYDLLRNENDSFYVKFDTPTPRPHFMMLPKNPVSIEHEQDDTGENLWKRFS